MPTIRPARLGDRDAAVALWTMLQDEYEALEPRLRRSATAERRWRNDFNVWVLSNAHGVFVAEAEGAVVGLVTAHPHWPAPVYEEQLEVFVTELVVHPDWRSHGLGRRLVEAVRQWAAEVGAVQVRAGVMSASANARAFWQRAGAEDFFVTVTLPVSADSD